MRDTENLLRRCGLFRDFDAAILDTIVRSTEDVIFDAGVVIVREGEAGDSMYVILAGAVQVYTQNGEGREVTLSRLEAGEYFGEQALLPGGTGRRYTSARAVEPVHLLRVPKTAFQSVLATNDALHEFVVEIGEEQVRKYLQQLSPLARAINLNTVGRLRRNLSPGEVLFHQGDESDALYFVTLGRLSVWRKENGVNTLIRYVERPGCVGELALLTEKKRTETVIAEDAAEVTGVLRAAFDEVYSESSEVRDYLATVQRAFELPQRGILTQHTGTFAGHECVTTLYHLNDRQIVAAYRVIGHDLYAVERLGATASETLTWQDGARSRDLRVDADGALVGLTARGDWPDVHLYHLFLLDGTRITSTERQQFLTSGRFYTRRAVATDVVCHCLDVREEKVRMSIQKGAKTFTRLQEETGCGSVCGGCVPVIAEMLGSEEWFVADVITERDEAPGTRSFELVPRDVSYPESIPGQHIVVEAHINGLRIRRPYTLSSRRRHGGRLRITVKHERGGIFSEWLFDNRPKGEPLRITRPRGENIIDLTSRTAVCLVAGIGVTPALAAAATMLDHDERAQRLLIHYSGRSRERMTCIQELESAAQHTSIQLIVRETSREGRLSAASIAKLVARNTNANWYVCGPESYLQQIRQWLKDARVADDRIRIETFTPVGTPIATREEHETFTRYILVPPQPAPKKPLSQMLRKTGKILHRGANTKLNPLRWIETGIANYAGADPTLPFEHLAIVSALAWGPYQYQIRAFQRFATSGAANRRRAEIARSQSRPLPEDTPDGDTFRYWMPAPPIPNLPAACRVDTGWTKLSDRRVVPTYVTRSRTALEYLLRRPDDTDRGALPYHFFQQIFGRTDVASCPGRKASGLFGGELHDNATWAEDRDLATDLFGFTTIDSYGPGMATAAEQTCTAIDESIARDPNAVVDLNVMLSKIAYTIIVRAVFGNIDLAEMHALGRTLCDSLREALGYVWEFVMGRQSVPPNYVKSLENIRRSTKRMIDLLRDLHRRGKISDDQRTAPVVRLVLDSAEEPDGAYEKLFALVLPIIIGGHETTAHAMTWAFYQIARDPELERKVLEEIQTFHATRGGRPIMTADYDERPMTWALLAECLRRHTPLPSVSRMTLRGGTVPADPRTGIGSFDFPSGALIVFSINGIHFDPSRWPDPYAFQPERWFEGVQHKMSVVEKGRMVRANIRAREQAMDWLPFSDGPGRCLGQHFNACEFFVILDALLTRYRFEMVNPDEEILPSTTVVAGPEQGRMAIRIRPRERRVSHQIGQQDRVTNR